jgi:LCP family protein required for cell wall assembly
MQQNGLWNTQPRPLWRRRVKTGLYGVLLVFCLAAGAIAGWINTSAVVRTVAYQWLTHKSPQSAWGGRNDVTLLILGCDEDLYYGGKQIIHPQARSDMMMVAKLDFKNNRITGVSIPRDTLAAPHGYRRAKINSFHLLGGPQLSKSAVESVLPVQIDRVVVLNYPAFQQMVDMVGGVRVDVPKKMDYDDNAGHLHIHLNPGVQTLNGVDAVGFVRFRHSDDDYHRQARQKAFMVAFKNAVIRRPGILMQVADKAREVMGNSLSPEEIGSLALFLKGVGNGSIKMGMIPTVSAGGYNLRVDRAKLPKVMRQFDLEDDRLAGAVSYNR